MSLSEYENKLLGCELAKSESVFQSVADSYEDDLLEFDEFPDEYFDFVLKLLSDRRYYSKAGLWNFLLVLGTESHRLSPHHYCRLRDTIIDHFKDYDDEDLCLGVCDFVARNYSFADAGDIFDRLEVIEKQKPESLHGFVVDGRRIMLAEEERRKA
ncbi:hypothetical protein [uncultured Vibrio sp.]|uniref:hypothetical protein n=1 Tax=uncultured Vibrio sp. TaxID=114054 RepID=UPI002AA85B87|nr:hypothetical protein [uncultured Vibrio sp.]